MKLIHSLILHVRITGRQCQNTFNIEVTGCYCDIELFIFSTCCAHDVAQKSAAAAASPFLRKPFHGERNKEGLVAQG